DAGRHQRPRRALGSPRRRRLQVIVPDVNVLVYAHREDAAQHERYAEWLAGVVAGADELGLVEAALTGFVRVVTHPRIFAEPAISGEPLSCVNQTTGAA